MEGPSATYNIAMGLRTVVSRTRAAGVALSLRLLFSHPTVATLAHVADEPDVIVRDLDRPGLLG